jgi:hypothetical protein
MDCCLDHTPEKYYSAFGRVVLMAASHPTKIEGAGSIPVTSTSSYTQGDWGKGYR